MNLSDLATFVRVAEHGTLAGAARALNVPKSTVSRRVSRLEDALGVSLLVRSGRAIALTDDGERLAARSSVALRELFDVEQELRESDGAPRGTLRLTCAPDLARQSNLTGLLIEYRARHPAVSVDVTLTNRVVDLVEEGFDVALRPNATILRDASTLMGKKLLEERVGLFASQSYIDRAGAPRTPQELLEHDCLAHPLMMRGGLPLIGPGEKEPRRYPLREAIIVNDFATLSDLVYRGAGIGVFFQRVESSGHGLVRVLPEYTLPSSALWIVWPSSRQLSPRVRAFVDLASDSRFLPSALGPAC